MCLSVWPGLGKQLQKRPGCPESVHGPTAVSVSPSRNQISPRVRRDNLVNEHDEKCTIEMYNSCGGVYCVS